MSSPGVRIIHQSYSGLVSRDHSRVINGNIYGNVNFPGDGVESRYRDVEYASATSHQQALM